MASFFDPKDSTPINAPTAKEEAPSSFFSPEDSTPIEPAASADNFFSPEDSLPVAAPEESRNWFLSKQIDPKEIQAIANKHKVDAKYLEDLAPYYGGEISGRFQDYGKQFGGLVNEALQGAGTFAYKKLFVDDPNVRAALDDLNQLAESKKSYARYGAELGAGFAIPGAIGTTAAAKIGSAAALGAAGFLGESKEGEEVSSALIGGTLGAGLGVVGEAAAPLIKKAEPVISRLKDDVLSLFGKGERKTAQKLAQELEADAPAIIDKIDETYAKRADEFTQADDLILKRPGQLEALDAQLLETRIKKQQPLDVQEMRLAQAIDESQKLAQYLEQLPAKPTVKEAADIIQQRLATESTPGLVKQQLEYMRKADIARELIGNNKVKDYSSLGTIGRWLMDGRYLARAIGRNTGLPVERWMDEATRAYNKYTVRITPAFVQAADIFKGAAYKTDDYREMIREYTTGGLQAVSPKYQPFMQEIKKFFDSTLKDIQAAGQKIEGRANYIPDTTLPLEEIIPKLKNRINIIEQSIKIPIDNLDDAQFRGLLKQAPFKELVDSVAYLSSANPKTVTTADRFRGLLANVTDRTGFRDTYEAVAAAAYRRSGEIPDLIRDYNLPRVMTRYITNGYKAAYMAQPLSKLRYMAQLAAEKGAKKDSEQLNALLADLTGMRRGTVIADSREIFKGLKQKALESNNQLLAAFAETAPSVFGEIAQNVYPAFLGLNPVSTLTNMMQPFVQTIPELGNIYGVRLAFQGVLDAAATLLRGKEIKLTAEVANQLNQKAGRQVYLPGQLYKTRSLSAILENEGLRAKQWNTELVGALESGVLSGSKVVQGYKKTSQTVTNALMYFYEGAESWNRTVVKRMADSLTDDLLAGRTAARRAIEKTADREYKQILGKALKSGKKEEVQKLVEDYLIGKTLYNYNRISLSRFGREMGPLFTVFTKFPASIASDIYDTLARQGKVMGLAELTRKYFMPFLAVSWAQQTFLGDPEEWPAPVKVFFNKEGLAKAYPITAIKNLLTGKVVPPTIKSAADGLLGFAALSQGDAYPLWKALNQNLRTYGPAWLIRPLAIMAEDVPRITGEERTGTFLQKVLPNTPLDEKFRKEE